MLPTQTVVPFAKGNQQTGETQHIFVLVSKFPVNPANLIVLAIGIIIAFLGSVELISTQNHRHSLTQEQSCHVIFHMLKALEIDHLIVAGTFMTKIHRIIVILSVAVVLAVILIMLLIVGDQVIQGKTIMGSDKVDTMVWTTTGVLIEVFRTAKTAGEITNQTFSAFPKKSYLVTIISVPLGPTPPGWKSADLIQSGRIPCLGNNLCIGQHRVYRNPFQ